MARHRPRSRPRRHRPPPRRGGVTAAGLVPSYKMVTPYRGPLLRTYFNTLSIWWAVIAGLGGLVLGGNLAGGFGAILGACLAFAWVARVFARGGYYRS
jgi:hypothetical protein